MPTEGGNRKKVPSLLPPSFVRIKLEAGQEQSLGNVVGRVLAPATDQMGIEYGPGADR